MDKVWRSCTAYRIKHGDAVFEKFQWQQPHAADPAAQAEARRRRAAQRESLGVAAQDERPSGDAAAGQSHSHSGLDSGRSAHTGAGAGLQSRPAAGPEQQAPMADQWESGDKSES